MQTLSEGSAWRLALLLGFCLATLAEARAEGPAKPAKFRVYFGTYTAKTSKGIYSAELDTASGTLSNLKLVAETPSPSFLAIHPSRKFLYAVNELDEVKGIKGGGVSAFAIDPKDGALTFLNQQSTRGAGPCHLVVDRTGKAVLVANYGGGSVAAFPLGEDGKLGEASSFIQHTGEVANKRRQGSPHGHSINLDAANTFAVAADLGLDQLLVYRFDPAKATLTPNDPPFTKLAPVSGPRHFAFHPDGHHAYVITEITCTVVALEYDPKRGVLTEIQTISTLPDGVKRGYSTAEIQVHPSGKFVYGSNRGHNSIAMFAVERGGKLRSLGQEPTQGRTPRNFGIDPTGTFLLAENQDSDTVVVFRIDPETGKLTATGQKLDVPMPVCAKFIPIE